MNSKMCEPFRSLLWEPLTDIPTIAKEIATDLHSTVADCPEITRGMAHDLSSVLRDVPLVGRIPSILVELLMRGGIDGSK